MFDLQEVKNDGFLKVYIMTFKNNPTAAFKSSKASEQKQIIEENIGADYMWTESSYTDNTFSKIQITFKKVQKEHSS